MSRKFMYICKDQPWLSGHFHPVIPGTCWYPYQSLVAIGRAPAQNCSCSPVKVLGTLVGTFEPLTLNLDVHGHVQDHILALVLS